MTRLSAPRFRLLGILAAACLLAVICGRRVLPSARRAASAVEEPPRRRPQLTRLEQTGERLYAGLCSYCHGEKGDGLGLNSSNLGVPPRDHTDAAYMGTLSDQDLIAVIKGGGSARRKSPLMPAWGGRLSDREIAALVAWLRSLTRK